MSGVEALARVLSGYRRTAIDTDQVKVPDLMSAERILTDPGPLLEALAEAGVLRPERHWSVVVGTSERYVTEWRPTDAR